MSKRTVGDSSQQRAGLDKTDSDGVKTKIQILQRLTVPPTGPQH